MVSLTSRLKLRKPATTDLIDIGDFNQNFDALDNNPGTFICTSTTRPASPFEGQKIYETDTQRTFVRRGSAWEITGWPKTEERAQVIDENANWRCYFVMTRTGPYTGLLSAQLGKLSGAWSVAPNASTTDPAVQANRVLPAWAQVQSYGAWNQSGFVEAPVSGNGVNQTIQMAYEDGSGGVTFRGQTTFTWPGSASGNPTAWAWGPGLPVRIVGH